jgi:rhamnogalacturonyl hydrolase YesR
MLLTFLKPHTALFFIPFFFWNAAPLAAQKGAAKHPDYKKELVQLDKAITKHFFDPFSGYYKEKLDRKSDENHFSYLWPLCALIQANNEIEQLGIKKGGVQHTLGIIEKYHSADAPAPGYAAYIPAIKKEPRFYDDNQWIGIALMDAYGRTKNEAYLEKGKMIYRFMMTGFDSLSGGGLYWQEGGDSSKNTCSNGPGILLALQLYKATNNTQYLDTALLLYAWTNEKLRAASHLYYDNINPHTGVVDQRMYSYNTGTMLQANVYLYEITKKEAYLKEAITIADSAQTYFLGSGKFRDTYWFNAVLLRAYQHLLKHHPNRAYIAAFRKCTDAALVQDKNSLGLMGKQEPLDLVSQGGMLEILARLVQLKQ